MHEMKPLKVSQERDERQLQVQGTSNLEGVFVYTQQDFKTDSGRASQATLCVHHLVTSIYGDPHERDEARQKLLESPLVQELGDNPIRQSSSQSQQPQKK